MPLESLPLSFCDNDTVGVVEGDVKSSVPTVRGVLWNMHIRIHAKLMPFSQILIRLRTRLWREAFVFPAYLAALSALLILTGITLRSKPIRRLRERVSPSKTPESTTTSSRAPEPLYESGGLIADIRTTIKSHGLTIFILHCIRFLSTLGLVAISVIAFVSKEEAETSAFGGNGGIFGALMKGKGGMKGGKKQRKHDRARDALQHAGWIELIQVAFYVRISPTSLISPQKFAANLFFNLPQTGLHIPPRPPRSNTPTHPLLLPHPDPPRNQNPPLPPPPRQLLHLRLPRPLASRNVHAFSKGRGRWVVDVGEDWTEWAGCCWIAVDYA